MLPIESKCPDLPNHRPVHSLLSMRVHSSPPLLLRHDTYRDERSKASNRSVPYDTFEKCVGVNYAASPAPLCQLSEIHAIRGKIETSTWQQHHDDTLGMFARLTVAARWQWLERLQRACKSIQSIFSYLLCTYCRRCQQQRLTFIGLLDVERRSPVRVVPCYKRCVNLVCRYICRPQLSAWLFQPLYNSLIFIYVNTHGKKRHKAELRVMITSS